MKAVMERVFIEKSNIGNVAIAPSIAIGIPTATHAANLKLKGMPRRIRTKIKPEIAEFIKFSILAASPSDTSVAISTLMPSGMYAKSPDK